MGPRRDLAQPQGTVREPGYRRQGGDTRGVLLPSRMQGSRRGEKGRPQRWRCPPHHAVDGDGTRRDPEASDGIAKDGIQGAQVSPRMWVRRSPGLPDPCYEAQKAEKSSRRRRMDRQSREDSPDGRRGRVGRVKTKSRAEGKEPQGKEAKRRRVDRGERQEEEQEKEEKEKERQRKEVQVGRRLSPKGALGWQEAETGSPQKATSSLQGHWHGQSRESSTEGCQDGKEVPQSKGHGQGQLQLNRELKHIEWGGGFTPWRGGHLFGDLPHQDGGGEMSWSLSSEHLGDHAHITAERDRVLRCTGGGERYRPPLLPAATSEASLWPSGQGVAHLGLLHRLPSAGASMQGPGPDGSAFQVLRVNGGWLPLGGFAKTGVDPDREPHSHSQRRAGRSSEGGLAGGEDKVECIPGRWQRTREEQQRPGQVRLSRQGRQERQRRQEGRKRRKRRGQQEGREQDIEERSSSGVAAPGPEETFDDFVEEVNAGRTALLAGPEETLGRPEKLADGSPDPAPVEESTGGQAAGGSLKTPGFLFPEAPRGGLISTTSTAVPLKIAEDSRSMAGKKDALCELSGLTLGDVGLKLQQTLLEVLPLRSQPTGKGEKLAIFPLPTSRTVFVALKPTASENVLAWTSCLCISLNSLWGGPLYGDEMPKGSRLACVLNLMAEAEKFCSLKNLLEEVSWTNYLKVRSIDYKGDEVQVARWFSWQNIQPAFPSEVGTVKLEDVCCLGSKHYVLNFDQYLKDPSEWKLSKAPRVMVEDHLWGSVCTGLVDSGVCVFIEEEEIFNTGQGPLLNGLFGVTKDEFTDSGVEIFRLIMNLIPLNNLCLPIAGDVNTLPAWSGMSPFFLQPSENLVVTSEDVKCFFYTMTVPECWIKYLAFNKVVPQDALPPSLKGRQMYIASRVLPMGFLNSVSLAQHVHRNLVQWSKTEQVREPNPPEAELRKDQAFTVSKALWRVYLDNYDLLEKVEATNMCHVEGSQAVGVLALRNEYERWQVPRNAKKAVARSSRCEVQGATVDGIEGRAFPRESKLGKYFSLAFLLVHEHRATQKQWQIACGGLVYFTMFRRQLLGSLNQVWTHIESYNQPGPRMRETPPVCREELLRFLGMLPLARMDFRLDVHHQVTCSDASESGGGACVSAAVTSLGEHVAYGSLRGEHPETRTGNAVLSVGLFDGIGALRVALEALEVHVIGHVSVEQNPAARRVVESHYPGTVVVEDVAAVDAAMVQQWATQFSQCNLVLLGGGPPCQGVSGLNADRRGALRDSRSSLFIHVPRIRDLLKRFFPWCPVHCLMESVRSMDTKDRDIMSEAIGEDPLECDAGTFTWCHRPRLYWLSWEVTAQDDVELIPGKDHEVTKVILHGNQPLEQVVRAGWLKTNPEKSFPTFTTSRPREFPGRKPAGILQCSEVEVNRWIRDKHRFPPYQYCHDNCLVNRHNVLRLPDVSERELMLGFPLDYTVPCGPKAERKGESYDDLRLTLLGNTWSVPVVAWLLSQLTGRLGLTPFLSPQDVVDRLLPGQAFSCQGRLIRLPLDRVRPPSGDSQQLLATKLSNLISIKGEDILLTTPTTAMVKHHRLRASVPARLWKWKIVAGWKWQHGREHINALELRAIFTTLRWRVEHQRRLNTRFIHLTDSLVCLHCLTRGRSSSRKLRRTMAKINALILASNTQPIWAYVGTTQNPADRPSRWGRRVKTKFRNAA